MRAECIRLLTSVTIDGMTVRIIAPFFDTIANDHTLRRGLN